MVLPHVTALETSLRQPKKSFRINCSNFQTMKASNIEQEHLMLILIKFLAFVSWCCWRMLRKSCWQMLILFGSKHEMLTFSQLSKYLSSFCLPSPIRILQHDDALNPLFRKAVLKYVQTASLKTAACDSCRNVLTATKNNFRN